MHVSFRPHWLLALALPLALAACGSDEPDQRAAFKQFLQSRILDKPGVHVPKLTGDESKSFGDYATHYAVITDFNSGMDASIQPLSALVQQGAIRSVGDVVTHKDDFKAVQNGLNNMATQLKQQLAKADSAHTQLKQPEDLKAVYDSAYDRTVTVPATTFLSVVPQINKSFDNSLKVADYLEAHKAQVEINGAVIQTKNVKVQEELNTLLQELNAQAKVVQDAQARIQAVILGR